jgi:hypothetical protein
VEPSSRGKDADEQGTKHQSNFGTVPVQEQHPTRMIGRWKVVLIKKQTNIQTTQQRTTMIKRTTSNNKTFTMKRSRVQFGQNTKHIYEKEEPCSWLTTEDLLAIKSAVGTDLKRLYNGEIGLLETDEISWRGLENYLHPRIQRNKKERRSYVNQGVLSIQQQLRAEGRRDVEASRNFMSLVSAETTHEALVKAEADAEGAKEIYLEAFAAFNPEIKMTPPDRPKAAQFLGSTPRRSAAARTA